jgi:N-acetylglucosamine-6-sulfatase
VGEHRRVGKTVGYEEPARVPLILSGPGLPSGESRRQLVSLSDVAPTIQALTGAEPGLVQDGLSLLPFAADADSDSDRAILLQAGPQNGATQRWYTAIRTRQRVYVEYDTGEREYYDLRDDPYQIESLHDDGRVRSVVRQLADGLTRLRECAGSTCQ